MPPTPTSAPRLARACDLDALVRINRAAAREDRGAPDPELTRSAAARAAFRRALTPFCTSPDLYPTLLLDAPTPDTPIGLLMARLQRAQRDTIHTLDGIPPHLHTSLPWLRPHTPLIEIDLLWVHPDHRRRGHATRLKHAIERRARQLRARALITQTLARNAHVIALNHRLGYTTLHTRPAPATDPDGARVVLAKAL